MTEEIVTMLREVLKGELTGAKAVETLEEILELTSGNVPTEKMALAGAIASKLLFDNPEYTGQEELSLRWKNYQCPNSASLTRGEIFIAASLLYDREDYAKAIDLFKEFLKNSDTNSDEFFQASMLTAYCYESLAKQKNETKYADAGLAVLDDLATRLKSQSGESQESRSAEILHARGHLHVARYMFSPERSKKDRQLGIEQLMQASRLNSAYTSCYTSVYSEVGDYLGTIEVSLEELEKQTYRERLAEADAETVEMEILFYVAHAYSCIAEYEKALQCFATFSDRMKSRGRDEAHAHGQLFTLKTHLKRSMLEDLSTSSIVKLRNQLGQISFPSRSSQSVSDEAQRYEDVLDFLRCLVEHREYTSHTDNLDDLYEEGLQLIRKLAKTVKDVVPQAVVLLIAENPQDSISQEIAQDLLSYGWILSESPPSTELLSRKIYEEVVVIEGQQNEVCARILDSVVREKFVITLSQATPQEQNGSCASGNPQYLRRVLVISTAFSLCKRFMMQNRYIFALAPCEDSPALKYQKPRVAFEQYL